MFVSLGVSGIGEECWASNAFFEVYERCQGENSCMLDVSSEMFGRYDSCPGLSKCLEIDYKCGALPWDGCVTVGFFSVGWIANSHFRGFHATFCVPMKCCACLGAVIHVLVQRFHSLEPLKEIVCKVSSTMINCPVGELIDIVAANYGNDQWPLAAGECSIEGGTASCSSNPTTA